MKKINWQGNSKINLENIKFIISYRVEKDNKNFFVEKALDHLKI